MTVVGKNSSYPAVFLMANTKNKKTMSRSWYFLCENVEVFIKNLPRNHRRKQFLGKYEL